MTVSFSVVQIGRAILRRLRGVRKGGRGNSIGAALGPLLSGALYDLTGSYLVIYVTAAVLLAASLAALLAFLGTTRETPPPSIR